MEATDYVRASALIGVTQEFVKLCEERKVDIFEAWKCVGNSLSLFSKVSLPQTSAQAAPTQVKLTKEEATQATREARESKARRLGLNPTEVNLTPVEAQLAREAWRARKTGSPRAPNTPVLSARPVGGEKKGLSTTQSSQLPTPLKGVRDTAKTRIDTLKRNLSKQIPTSKEDPRSLHLVAYANSYSRLRSQWKTFQDSFNVSNMQNPLEKFPDPFTLPKTGKLLEEAVEDLRPQTDSPNTWILQDGEGKSFFDRDRPSAVCPKRLALPIPMDVLTELYPHFLEDYPKIWNHEFVLNKLTIHT
jgi:hypothetical protein